MVKNIKEIKHDKAFYSKELQELIANAEKDGFIFSDGTFDENESVFPVMEALYINNSTDEDTGYYQIYKKTVKISKEDYDTIFEFAKTHNYKEFKVNCSDVEDSFENILCLISKYDQFKFDYVNTNRGGTITVQYTIYGYGDDKQYAVDLWFDKQFDDDDFPRGFISFYLMKENDFKKAENVDMLLKKYLRNN